MSIGIGRRRSAIFGRRGLQAEAAGEAPGPAAGFAAGAAFEVKAGAFEELEDPFDGDHKENTARQHRWNADDPLQPASVREEKGNKGPEESDR